MNELYITGLTVTKGGDGEGYPFNIPAIGSLKGLEFAAPVTFFVGANGSGKSTLLEAIAAARGFNPEGGSRNMTFSTYESHSPLYKSLKLTRGPHMPTDGYFLRAESFYNVASHIEELDSVPAFAPPIKNAYGGSLHERSHGESFAALFFNRLHGRGLYLLDEPEAALSVNAQLSALSRIRELTEARSQFIIATHSPILLAYPGADILSFDGGTVHRVEYEDTEVYRIYKYFMNNREGILKELGFLEK